MKRRPSGVLKVRKVGDGDARCEVQVRGLGAKKEKGKERLEEVRREKGKEREGGGERKSEREREKGGGGGGGGKDDNRQQYFNINTCEEKDKGKNESLTAQLANTTVENKTQKHLFSNMTVKDGEALDRISNLYR